MIAGLKSYFAYKDSGVPWLGKVPAHWEVAMVKQNYTIQLGKMLQPRPNTLQDAEIPYLKAQHVQWFRVRTADAPRMWASQSDIAQFGVVPGDLLVCEGGDGGRCGILRQDVEGYIIQNALHRVRPGERSRNDYLQYVLSSVAATGWFDALNNKATIAHFTREKFGALRVPIPPLSEQNAIVRFLDHADRRIRRYIRGKQKLIALLEEQKQAIIHQAVTGQIDVRTGQPYPAYKPSGVEWLGDVPAHWNVRRVKQGTRVLRGKFTHRPRNDPSLYDGPYPFIQTGEVARAEGVISSYRQTLNERGLAVSRMFPAGTLVMAIAANIGDVAILDFEACFPDSVVGFVPRNGVERDFLYYVFRAMKPELVREAPVNTQGNLNIERIDSKAIAIAPINEQRLIVRQIETSTAELNTATNQAKREIDLLREYRTRLTADVVTGKLDVRGAATGLPEIDPMPAEDNLDGILETDAERNFDKLDATPGETAS